MPNKIDLTGRNAVVTGGAQGIGRAIVERFLESGAAVAIWDRDAGLAKKAAAELQKRGMTITRPDMTEARKAAAGFQQEMAAKLKAEHLLQQILAQQ